MNASNAAKHSLSEHDERVHTILSQASTELSGAADFLSDYGISQELAQKVTEMLKTPLIFLYNQHESTCRDIAKIMREIVVSHVQRVAQDATVSGFWEVERGDGGSTMEYTIALREYTLEKRALLRSFKNDYQCTGLCDLAPLVFHIIPEKRAANVLMSKKLELQ